MGGAPLSRSKGLNLSSNGDTWDWKFWFDIMDMDPPHPIREMEHCPVGDRVKIARMRRGKYVLLDNFHSNQRAHYERRRYNYRRDPGHRDTSLVS